MIAREAVAEVLAEPRGVEGQPHEVVGERPARVAGAAPGSVVPVWREGLAVAVLSPDYQQLMSGLVGGSGVYAVAKDCREARCR